MNHTIRLGTRGSDLALWQTNYVKVLLEKAWPEKQFDVQIITTRGDVVLDTPLPLIGGKGLFTAELETALREGQIDLAVHSLKDLPTESPDGLTIGAIPERAAVNDALISQGGHTLATLPMGSVVGTSSTRRSAQIMRQRPDLEILDIRGNVPTRVKKALDPAGPYDAVVLACAGLERLGMRDVITETLALDVMLPAPGQGALAVQCRDDGESRVLLRPLLHSPTQIAVTAERAFLAGLGGGCSLPIAAYAAIDGQTLRLAGRVLPADGSQQIDVSGISETLTLDAISQLGAELAQQALNQGANEII
jgi:hydroxymethylbilane synthase